MKLRQALIETGSNIVSGPDENGSYIVELVVPNEDQLRCFSEPASANRWC